jgi:hypothetical protein
MDLLGIRTVIYPAPDLAAAKAATTALLGIEPYFDEPFYVGYAPAGYEFGLDPNADPAVGAVTYWGVPDLQAALDELAGKGIAGEAVDTGDGIRVATVVVPGLGSLGLIENPNFVAADVTSAGPGR